MLKHWAVIFVQVGDWLYWLIDCYTNLSPLNLPTFYNRMIKFAIGRNVNLEYTDLLVEPIGMYAPSSIATADPEAGIYQERINLVFSYKNQESRL